MTAVAFPKNSQALHPAGCDDGHWGMKVCAGEGKYFVMPSRAHPGKISVSSISGESADDLVYETSPGEFVTITAYDMLSPAVDTRLGDFPTSSPNRALVAHALRHAGVTGPTMLVTGLPVNRFYSGGVRNDALIEAKRESLLRPLRSITNAALAEIKTHKVISEAVAAYYDALLNFDGTYNEEFKDISDELPVAVLDAGGKTLDIATVREGGSGIYQAQSGTADAGVLYLYDLLDTALRQAFKIADPIPVHRLEKVLRDKTYRLYGDVHDVKTLVDAQLNAFADRVNFESSKLLGDASRYGKVLFVGGGANLLADRLDRVFPGLPRQAITVAPVSDNPNTNSQFANARGMYKAACAALSAQ